MIADANVAKNLGSRPDLDVIANDGDGLAFLSGIARVTDGHLLKDRAVRSNNHILINDDPIRMWEQKAAGDPAIDRDICPGNYAPKSIAHHHELGDEAWQAGSGLAPMLIPPDRQEELAAWVPWPNRAFSGPIRQVW